MNPSTLIAVFCTVSLAMCLPTMVERRGAIGDGIPAGLFNLTDPIVIGNPVQIQPIQPYVYFSCCMVIDLISISHDFSQPMQLLQKMKPSYSFRSAGL